MAVKKPRMIVNGCPECGSHMILRESKHGKFYGCHNFPKCKATHGANQLTGEPLGKPANEETKKWRKQAHEQFDFLWQKGHMPSRDFAYDWLAKIMNMSPKDAHIANFNIEQCKELIEHVTYYETDDTPF
jgi:ssDNA-binding Zn-finger/Zn-ribbon topoisomerase 1